MVDMYENRTCKRLRCFYSYYTELLSHALNQSSIGAYVVMLFKIING